MAFRILSIASVCHDADSIQTSVVRVASSSHQTGSENKLLRGSEGGRPSLPWPHYLCGLPIRVDGPSS